MTIVFTESNPSRFMCAAVAAMSLVIAACGSGSDDADVSTPSVAAATTEVDTAPATNSVGGTEPAPEPEVTTPAATEPEPDVTTPPATEPEPDVTTPPVTEPDVTTPPVTEPETPGGCLVGDWYINPEGIDSYYAALAGSISAAGAAVTMETTGDATVSFTETTYTYSPNFELTMSVLGNEAVGTGSGSLTGTWVAVDGVLETTITDSNLEILVNVGGATQDGSEFGNGILAANPLSNMPFDCDGPILQFLVSDDPEVRHPVPIEPA